MPGIQSPSVAYYSRFLVADTPVTLPTTYSGCKALFTNAEAYTELHHVLSVGELASTTPNYANYPVFGQDSSSYVEGQGTQNQIELVVVFNSTLINTLSALQGSPTVLATAVLDSSYTGVLTDAAMGTRSRSLFFSTGTLKVLGTTTSLRDVSSFRLLWTPINWQGPGT